MSAILKDLYHKKMKVIEEYYFQIRENEKYYQRDYKAALKIQTFSRMLKQRKIFMKKRSAAIKLQRLLRLVFAVLKFKQILSNEINRRNISYFSNQAKIIQKQFQKKTNKIWKVIFFNIFKVFEDSIAENMFMTFMLGKNI